MLFITLSKKVLAKTWTKGKNITGNFLNCLRFRLYVNVWNDERTCDGDSDQRGQKYDDSDQSNNNHPCARLELQ